MIGTEIGPWKVCELLGSGAMGRVYRAEDTQGRAVAIKVLHPQLTPHEEARARFVREARFGTGLDDPRLVKTTDLGRLQDAQGELVYLVMEFVEGQTVRALLQQDGQLSEELVRHIGLEVASALDTIHRAGVLHRDLKPENILISRDHAIKVMDLGLARLQDDVAGLSRTGQFLGTLLYAAPEQLEGQRDLDGRADLYGLGALLYELLHGKNPFDCASVAEALQKQLTYVPPPLVEVVPNTSPWLSDLVAALLGKRAATRPASAAVVVEALTGGPDSAWWQAHREEAHARARRRRPALGVDPAAPHFGRADRMARLDSLLEAHARDRHFSAARIVGAPGSGVTRTLAAWIEERRVRQPEETVVAHALTTGTHLTRALVHATVRALGGGESPASLAALTDLSEPEAAALGTVSSSSTVTRRTPRVLAGDRADRVLFTLLARLARGGMLVIVVDGVHNLDAEERHRLERLRADLAHIPLLWLEGSHRLDEETEGLPRVDLGPLDEPSVRALVEHELGEGGAADEVLRRLTEGGVGNPALILNWLRTLRRDGVLVQGERGAWRFEAGATDVASALPATLRAAIEQRIDRLTAEDATLLGTCAVLGARFDPSDVVALLDAPPLDVLRRLSRVAHHHGLLRSEGDRFAFRPAWVVELAAPLLDEAARVDMHGRMADRLKTKVTQDPVALCHHNLRAGRIAEAVAHALPAIGVIRGEGNTSGALELCEAVLTASHDLADLAASRIEVQRAAAEIELHMGRWQQALARLAEAREACSGDPHQRASILNRMGTAHYLQGDLDASRLALHEAHLLAVQLGDPHTLIEAKTRLGILATRENALVTAKRHLALACQIARERGLDHLEGGAQLRLATVYIRRSELDPAETCLLRALALAEADGNARLQVTTRGNLAWFDLIRGQYDDARAKVETAIVVAREHGFTIGVMQAEGNLAHLELKVGRFDKAGEHIALEATRVAESDPGPGHLHLLQHEADLALLTGNLLRARELLEGALARARRWHYVEHVGTALHQLGQLAYELGDPKTALAHFDEAVELLEGAGAHIELIPVLLSQAEVHMSLGHASMAAVAARDVFERADPLDYIGPRTVASCLLARLEGGDLATPIAKLRDLEPRLGYAEFLEASHHLAVATREPSLVARAVARIEQAARTLPVESRETFRTVPRRHHPFH